MSSLDLPDLDHLKRQAKRLKRAFAAGDPEALRRAHAHLSQAETLKHADALHVVAREHGHASWPRLKFAVEQADQDPAARARTLQRALFFGQSWIVDALLEQDPTLPEQDPALRIALYDDAWALPWLAEDSNRATTPLGRRTPILHLAFSQHHRTHPDRRASMVGIARRLLELGADPNDGYAPDPEGTHRLSALYGALGHADNLPLARLLLEAGADPNDDESLFHATELPHAEGLELLLEHGARTEGTNALLRALDGGDLRKVQLLLDAGADPNEPVRAHPSGLPMQDVVPLHQAARRGASAEVVSALVDAGADPRLRWNGRTPYATARIFGNTEAATRLEQAGAATALSETDELLARCAEGADVDASLELAQLSDEDRRLPVRVASDPEALAHLKALLQAGLRADVQDEMGLTPLQIALWQGLPEHAEFLLTQTPDFEHRNAYGGDALGTLVHGSEFCPASGRDHVGCARLLMAAGCRPPSRAEVDACGDEELAGFLSEVLDAVDR